MPRVPAWPEIREADMSAVGRGFEVKIMIFQSRGSGKRWLVQQGTVHGIEQQGRHADAPLLGSGYPYLEKLDRFSGDGRWERHGAGFDGSIVARRNQSSRVIHP